MAGRELEWGPRSLTAEVIRLFALPSMICRNSLDCQGMVSPPQADIPNQGSDETTPCRCDSPTRHDSAEGRPARGQEDSYQDFCVLPCVCRTICTEDPQGLHLPLSQGEYQ
jgi:hypothetical protein